MGRGTTQRHRSAAGQHRGRLLVVLCVTALYMLVEVVTGVATNSLVLIADAGHMLTDVLGLGLASLAIWFASRPATPQKTYGYYRAEILAAATNAVVLFAVSAYILYEAYRRFVEPPQVNSLPMLAVASVGLAVNVFGAWMLRRGAGESLNIRGAYLEALSDLLGSAGAISAGVILLTTGWRYADPLFAAGIGLFILPRTWHLLRSSVDVLMEATPPGVDIGAIQRAMLSVPAVQSVHDLHVWTVTSGFISLSAHVETDEGRGQHHILVDLRRTLVQRFGIEHATLQLETQSLHDELEACCHIDSEVST